MLKRNLVYILFIYLVLFSISCTPVYEKYYKSADDYFNYNSYDNAVYECVNSLMDNKNYTKSQNLLQKAFPKAVEGHSNYINQYKLSSNKFKWDLIVREYEELIKLNDAIQSLPLLENEITGERINFKIIDYEKQLTNSKKNAALEHYNEGILLSKNNGIEVQKQAAKEFKQAMYYVNDFKDAYTRYNEARKSGTKRISILKFEDKTNSRNKFRVAVAEALSDSIQSKLINDSSAMEFLEIVSRNEMDKIIKEQAFLSSGFVETQNIEKLGKILDLHEIVLGKISIISYSPEKLITKDKLIEANLKVGIKTENVNGVEKYIGDINEKRDFNIRFYNKETSAEVTGSYSIIDIETGKIKKSDTFSKRIVKNSDWAEILTYPSECYNKKLYESKTDCLSKMDSNTINLVKKGETSLPRAEDLLNESINSLSDTLSKEMKLYFN